jgi:hypothetical protein
MIAMSVLGVTRASLELRRLARAGPRPIRYTALADPVV